MRNFARIFKTLLEMGIRCGIRFVIGSGEQDRTVPAASSGSIAGFEAGVLPEA
jgi:hypothetical protein